MDSLTHLAAGALTPLAFRNAPRIGAVVLFGIVAGEFPDIDILAGTAAEAMLVFHRSLTHSVPALLLWSVLLALAFRFILSRLNYRKTTVRIEDGAAVFNRPGDWSFKGIWAAALLALVLHVYLDCMTTFGTQVLWPVSDYRVALPALFIVDPFFTIPLLLVLLSCLIVMRKPDGHEKSVRRARRTLVWVVVYPLLCLGVHEAAQYKIRMDFDERQEAGAFKISLAPMPLSPWKWKAVVDDGTHYRLSGVTLADILKGRELNLGKPFQKPAREDWQQFREALPIFDGYAKFVSFPAVHGVSGPVAGGEREIRFTDLRYLPADKDDLMHKAGRGNGMFFMELRINDRDNALTAWRYLERLEHAAATPWEELDPPVRLGKIGW